MKRILVAIALAPLLLVSAAATSLSLISNASWFVDRWERCTSERINASISGENVSFALPESCVGQRVRVSVAVGSKELTQTLIGARTNQVGFPQIVDKASDLFISANTWWLASDFVTEAGGDFLVAKCEVENGYSCEATFTIEQTWQGGYVVTGKITTDSSTLTKWKLFFDGKDAPPLPFVTNVLIDQRGSFLVLVNEPNCTDRILEVEAVTDWGEQHLVSAM